MTLGSAEIKNNLEKVKERVYREAQSAGRKPGDIHIVVVTKWQTTETVQAVIDAGAEIIGENYPEEAILKIQSLENPSRVEWHMIGHVQSRKARLVCSYFDMIHSLDSLKLADKLNQIGVENQKKFPVCLEMNVGGEETKGGWEACDENQWDSLKPIVETCLRFTSLQIKGLMVMPPWFDDPEKSRAYFVKTRHLQDFLTKSFPQADFSVLSMGTSIDYPVAVQEGATHIRIGEAIVGKRIKTR